MMQLEVSLHRDGPAVWFLGPDTKHLKAYLTVARPGPVELDFDSLTEQEQREVLTSQKDGKIEVSVTFDKLYQYFRDCQAIRMGTTPPTQAEQVVQKVREQRVPKIDPIQKVQERQKQLLERAGEILNQKVHLVKASLSDERDMRFLNLLLKTEREGKSRKTIVAFLSNKIAQLQKHVLKSIDNSAKTPPLRLPGRPDPVSYDNDVIESEQEVIEFSMGSPPEKT